MVPRPLLLLSEVCPPRTIRFRQTALFAEWQERMDDDTTTVAAAHVATDLMRHFAIVLAFIVAATALTMILMARFVDDMSLAYLVFLFGTVGGVANNYRRVAALIAASDDVEIEADTRKLVTMQVYVSPVIGGVFAVVLYGLFMAQTLIAGDLFPSFEGCAGASFDGLPSFSDCAPESNADVAKAFVWAFAAGFLERLVPNFISALAPQTS